MAEKASDSGLRIPGTQIFEELGRGTQCIVYRAVREGQSYALKVNRKDPKVDSGSQAVRFRREAAVLARLHHVGLPRVYEVGETDDGVSYEIMELVQGRTLDAYLGQGPLDENTVIHVAKILAGAMTEIHAQGLIHRDIKPQNIVASAGVKQVKLIDFGFAADAAAFEKESKAAVGTFKYSAPEQLGVMQRSVDNRSDLYAAGAVLFECATGKPPFSAREVGELLRMHAVTTPPNVHEVNPAMSPAFAKIIAKLLAKDPDDRYQDAANLLIDLEQLLLLNSRLSRGEAIRLDAGGMKSYSRDRNGEMPFAGRSTELELLVEMWDDVRDGNGAILFLQGEPGSGKSRLIREFVSKAFQVEDSDSVRFLTGKCTQERGISFGPFREAVESYLKRLSTLAPEPKEKALANVKEAAGDFTAMLRHLTPGLNEIFSAESASGREDKQELFYSAIATFVLKLGAESLRSPLILFIDDVQWLDESSQKVCSELCVRLKNLPVLLVFTSRNQEENKESLERFKRETFSIVDPSVRIQEITLSTLGPAAVGELISSHLGGFRPEGEFIEQILSRTDGSPFAIGEYLRAMLEAGLLKPYWGSWQLNLKGLESLSLPTDVVQLVLRRVETLSEESRAALSAAAVIGTTFRPELLEQVISKNGETQRTHSILFEASQARLIEKDGAGAYSFIHDRVQEALLARLSSDDLQANHQRVAEVLDGQLDQGLVEQKLRIARHYIQGERLKNPAKLYRSCMNAAKVALESYADGDAYSFLKEAQSVATAFELTPDKDHDELSAVAAQRTQMYDEAIEYFKDAIAKCDDSHRRAYLRARLMRIYTVNLQTGKALEQMTRAFFEIDVRVPRMTLSYAAVAAWDWFVALAIRTTGIGYGTLSPAERQNYQTLARLYEVATLVAYYSLQERLTYMLLFRSMRIVARLGVSPEMAVTYSRYAPGPSRARLHRTTKWWANRAIQVAEQAGEPTVLAASYATKGTTHLMLGEELEGEAALRHALDKHGQWLVTEEYFSAAGALRWTYGNRGLVQEQLQLLDHETERLAGMGGQSEFLKTHFLSWIYSAKIPLLVIQGRASEALVFKRKLEALNLNNAFDRLHAYGDMIAFYLEQRELGAPAEEAIRRFEDYAEIFTDNLVPVFLHQCWLFRAQMRLAQAEEADEASRPAALKKFEQAFKDFKYLSITPIFLAHRHVLWSAYLTLIGKPKAAIKELAEAHEFGSDQGAPWILFLVHHCRAKAFRALKNEYTSLAEAKIAFDIAERNGWVLRARWIAKEFPGSEVARGFGSTSVGSESGTFGGSMSRTNDGRVNVRLQQQLGSLMQVSLSSATVLNPELQARTVLDEIVRVLNAERAFLLMCHDLDPKQEFELRAGRDASGGNLTQLTGYSSTVIREVRAQGKPLIVSGSEEGAVLGSESVIAHDLRSIIAAPVKIRGEVVGVVYLDNRMARGIFTREDIEILEALAAHIAVSMEVSRTLKLEMDRQALHESVERLRTILANVPIVLFELDPQGICRLAAGKLFATLGIGAEEAVGRSFITAFHGHAAMQQSLKRALAGEAFSMDIDLGEKFFEIYFQPMRGSSDELQSTIAVAIDNTERKRAEVMLTNSSKMSALGEMAGGVAHEINNPLAIINIMAGQLEEIFEEGGSETDSMKMAKELLKKIQGTVDRIARIVKGLRSFARDAQQDPTRDEAVKSIVEDTIALCSERFKANAVKLIVEPPTEEVLVPCRSTQISQVVLNLVNNAYDAIKPNAEKWVKISWQQDDIEVRISVTDSGNGIPSAVVQKIFQPFFTTKAVGSGTGLGLSISKGLVENHGGRLEYDTKSSNTRFDVVLPRRQNVEAAKGA